MHQPTPAGTTTLHIPRSTAQQTPAPPPLRPGHPNRGQDPDRPPIPMAPLELLRRLLALVLRLLNALLGVLGLGPVAFPASFPGGGRGGRWGGSSSLTGRTLRFSGLDWGGGSGAAGGGSGGGGGLAVRIGRQIAEGGFSFVFEAYDAGTPTRLTRKYALKRINCSDPELVRSCREEAGVHRSLRHPGLLPLLGLRFESSAESGATCCYMLFPYHPSSLRDDLTARSLLEDGTEPGKRRPYREAALLACFGQVVDAVGEMHSAGLAHRDIKVENVLLAREGGGSGSGSGSGSGRALGRPVLMDFGSVGPVSYPLRTRSDVLNLAETASQHCTMPYRAPELFDGGVRHGPDEPPVDGRIDVWSLGCLLFAMMYGSSPFEVDFRGDGTVRIVECTHLRVLGPVPSPPPSTEAAGWFSSDLVGTVRWILNQGRSERPTLDQVSRRVDELLKKAGGTRVRSGQTSAHTSSTSSSLGVDAGPTTFDAFGIANDMA